jgi:HEAT repeat protein
MILLSMGDLEKQIRERFLDQLDNPRWDDEDPRLCFGIAAVPFFLRAFAEESNPQRRVKLIRVIGQFRDPSVLPTLAGALRDINENVWKDALDGLVTIGGDRSLEVLREARADAARLPDASKKIEWIDEAISQLKNGFYPPGA